MYTYSDPTTSTVTHTQIITKYVPAIMKTCYIDKTHNFHVFCLSLLTSLLKDVHEAI